MQVPNQLEPGEALFSLRAMIECKAPKTQDAYRYSLDALAAFLGCKKDSYEFERALITFTPMKAAIFLSHLRKQTVKDGSRLSDNTIALRAANIRKVFSHLIDIGARVGNPMAVIKDSIPARQKTYKRPTKLIPFDKVQEILDVPDRTTKKGVRDRALLAVLFGGGLRRSEALKLNLADIDQAPDGTPYLVLRGTKAGIDQQQSLPPWAWARLLQYLEQRYQDDDCGDDFRERPLFVFYFNNGMVRDRMCDKTLVRIYKRCTKAIGVSGAAPHSARATAVTMLKELGFEDRAVAQFLRHSTTRQVEIYDKRSRGPSTNPGRKLVYVPRTQYPKRAA